MDAKAVIQMWTKEEDVTSNDPKTEDVLRENGLLFTCSQLYNLRLGMTGSSNTIILTEQWYSQIYIIYKLQNSSWRGDCLFWLICSPPEVKSSPFSPVSGAR